MSEHECPSCGDGFENEAAMKSHHYHAHGESIARVEISCEACGSTFEVKPKRKDTAKYCSMACTRNQVELTCERCGGSFTRPPSTADGARFCSNKCRGEWHSENVVGEAHPLHKKNVEKECQHCSQTFEVKPSRSGAIYCSIECSLEELHEYMRSEENPLRGSGDRKYGPGWNEGKREQVRSRDCHECQGCGMTSEEHFERYGRNLDVHHITPARDFDDPHARNAVGNLITLCRPCHVEWEKMSPLRPDTAEPAAD